MPVSREEIQRLAKANPYSAAALRLFAPLLNARIKLIEMLAPPALPPLDATAFAGGKPWMESANLPLGADLLRKAPKALTAAAAKIFPEEREAVATLGSYLAANPTEVENLVRAGLGARRPSLASWGKRRGFPRNVVEFFSAQLAAVTAGVAARAARDTELPSWGRNRCPICGGAAHAYALRGREGVRFLECGLCGFEYRFSRTACSACGKESSENLSYFFLEDHPERQAEACKSCHSYLLGLDAREMVKTLPLAVYLLCMLPLDALMQDKGFAPAPST